MQHGDHSILQETEIGQRIREKYGFYIETYMEYSETPKVPDLELCH